MLLKALTLLLILTLPSCNKPQEGVLIIADTVKIDKTTAADSTILWESVIGGLVYTSLSHTDNDLVWHNLLAEEVRALPGGRAIEIRIRKGVRLHDGREMTESDAAASFSRIIETNKYFKEKYGQLRVKIVDKQKITVTGEKPLSDLNRILFNLYVSSKNLTGTGPFKFFRWIEDGVELIANNDYFEGTPKLKRVVYRYEPDERKRINMLLKGEVDLLIWLSPERAGFLKKDQRFYVNEWNSEFYSAVFFNNESPLFRDRALREAVSMAIDRDKLIKKALTGGGKKKSDPLPHKTFPTENNTDNTDYSPKEAARVLKDAGWKDADGDGILEKNGKKLKFRLYYNVNVNEFKKMTDLISQDLFEIGIGVETIPANMDESTDRNFETGSYDAVLEAKSSNDGVNYLSWGSTSLKNYSRLSDRNMDNLLARLKEVTDIEQKKEIYSKMRKFFEEEVPAAFLYSPVIYSVVNRKFKGAEKFVASSYSMYKIKDWSLNEDFR